MFRKMTILAMALGVVAAMGLPASAGANWKHFGQPIQSNVQLPFTGTSISIQSQFVGGGYTCQVTSLAQFKGGQTTGTAQSFQAHPTSDTANCFGTGGLAFCQVHNLQPQTGFNWVIHTVGPQTTSVTITYGEITAQTTGGFCLWPSITVKQGSVTGTVDVHKASTVTLSGKVRALLGPNEGEFDVGGVFHLEQTPTYEI